MNRLVREAAYLLAVAAVLAGLAAAVWYSPGVAP